MSLDLADVDRLAREHLVLAAVAADPLAEQAFTLALSGLDFMDKARIANRITLLASALVRDQARMMGLTPAAIVAMIEVSDTP